MNKDLGAIEVEAEVLPPAIKVRRLSKAFGGQQVLRDLDLDVAQGEIHAIVGPNGSGKSTLVKILCGLVHADQGEIWFEGKEMASPSGEALARAGVGFVHQNVPLAESMPVLDNLLVGQYDLFGGVQIRWQRERQRALDALQRLRIDIDLDAVVKDLPLHSRAIVAVARAVMSREFGTSRVLIMDEPTAALARGESGRVLQLLTHIAKKLNVAVLIVDHRLDEVAEIADAVTVLRDGLKVRDLKRREISEDAIIELMVGGQLGQYYPDKPVIVPAAEALLAIDVRCFQGDSIEAKFTVDNREIVGISGLPGSGFDTVPYVLAGSEKGASGSIRVGSSVVDIGHCEVADVQAAGLVVVPADRAGRCSAGALSLKENISMITAHSFRGRGRWSLGKEGLAARSVLDDFRVIPNNLDTVFESLSGGNQQKAIVGGWLKRMPKVIVFHEPTEGVDVAGKRELFKIIRETAAAGAAVVVCSGEADDLAGICDRVLIFKAGVIVIELSGPDLTGDRILVESL